MAFVPISNACAVELRFTYNTQNCEYTLGFHNSSGVTEANLQTLTNFLGEWWYNQGRSRHSNQVSLREIYARDLTTEGGPAYTSTTRAGTPGTLNAGTILPNNAAFCVSFRTAGRGRANRGRNYCMGFGASQLSAGNTVIQAYVDIITAWYRMLLPGGTYDPTPYRWVVLSRQLNGVVTGRAVPITAVIAPNLIVDSMRKRLPGRGT